MNHDDTDFSISGDKTVKTRNSEVLASFVEYCEYHPDERFWQALRNWAGVSLVLVVDLSFSPARDTFYWEKINDKS
jgi:hypothetical protein